MTLVVIVVLIMNLMPLGVDPVNKIYMPMILTSSPCSFSSDELVFLELIRNHPDQTRYLECSQLLHNSASFKSNDMATRNYINHVSPDGVYANELVKMFGCNIPYDDKANYVENLVAGTADPNVAFEALMRSDGHRALLMGVGAPFDTATHIGIAMASGNNSYYWTIHICKCD